MRILVVDVAAEFSGALSVLKQYIEKFREDSDNEYYVCVSVLDFQDSENVHFLKLPWVKRSHLHRLYFDLFYIKKLTKTLVPDLIFSLQNKAFHTKIDQEVFFQNALFICEKRFSLRESKKLWVYQNVISRLTRSSLKNVRQIYVQAPWIKRALSERWKIDEEKITVKRPEVHPVFRDASAEPQAKRKLFYPANYHVYKNHATLLQACAELWEEKGSDFFSLYLTGTQDALPDACKRLIENKNYPIVFLGKLTPEEMKAQYLESVLVFPSYLETAGLPLVEARSLGCKILAADCEYARDMLDGYLGVSYFLPFDAKQMKELINDHLVREL